MKWIGMGLQLVAAFLFLVIIETEFARSAAMAVRSPDGARIYAFVIGALVGDFFWLVMFWLLFRVGGRLQNPGATFRSALGLPKTN